MMHPTVKILVLILLIIGLSISIIYFTKMEEQKPGVFGAKIENELTLLKDSNEALIKEYIAGEYYTKIGELDKAISHYKKVYRNYPKEPKSYLKWKAKTNITQLEKVKKILKAKNINESDTKSALNEYFRYTEKKN